MDTLPNLDIGTQLRTSEHGIFLYRIKAQKASDAAKGGWLYCVAPAVVGEQIEIPEVWVDEEVLRERYWFVGQTSASYPAGDPAVGAAGSVADAAPATPLGPFDPSTRLHDTVVRLRDLGRLAESTGLDYNERRELQLRTFDLAAWLGIPSEPSKRWDGNHCPYCGSGEIDCEMEHQFDLDTAWQSVTCNACHRQYAEDYVLRGATTRDGECPVLAYTYEGEVLAHIDEVKARLEGIYHELDAIEMWQIRGINESLQQIISLIPASKHS